MFRQSEVSVEEIRGAISSATQPPHMRKEAQFLLFTDWEQTQSGSTPRDVEHWPPFAANNPKDVATMKDLKQAINIRLDGQLNPSVDPPDRVYFRHTNFGVELIHDGGTLQWESLQGAIVDPDTAARNENFTKLSAMAKGLARKAPDYIRERSAVLICLLPGSSAGPPVTFPAAKVLKVEPTKDSKGLVAEVLAWLTTLNVQIEDDRMNAPKELREAVEIFLEKNLV